MNRHLFITVVLVCTIGASSQAMADHDGVEGLLIGAGSGAILGNVIGGDTQSTVVGATVGGALGYIIDRNDHKRRVAPVHYGHLPRHDRNRHFDHQGYRPNYREHHSYTKSYPRKYDQRTYRHYGDDRRWRGEKVCERQVRYKEHHGRLKKVVKTTCWYERSGGHKPYYPSRYR